MNKLVAWLRREGRAGQYLRPYERARYTTADKAGIGTIIVSPEAEELADVSFYQKGMNWARYPHRTAILRISQNVWQDPSFETFYAEARANGKRLGGYTFWDDRATPEQQANTVKKAMAGKQFEMEIYVDVERFYGGPYGGDNSPAYIRKLIELIEASGIVCKAVGTYTGYYFWKDKILPNMTAGDRAFFAARPLYLAWYASASIVQIPQPWTDWTLWQWGTPAVDWGQPTKEIDANKSRYSRAEFEARYLGGTTPPPNGGTMQQWKITWANGAQLRTGPAITNGWAPITPSLLPLGAVVNVIGYKINTAGVEEWAQHENGYWFASIYNSQPRAENVTPPVVTEDVTVTIQRDGWKDLTLTGKQEKL